MGKKLPKNKEYLDTTIPITSGGKKLLKDKSFPDEIIEKYKENELNEDNK